MTAQVGLATLFSRPGASFYDGVDGRDLVKCPDCGQDADAMFGSHGGQCIPAVKVASPNSALGIVRAQALHGAALRFSMNDLRRTFEVKKVPTTSAAPALKAAVKNGWIEEDGTVPSTAASTKRHAIKVYRSLIHESLPKKAAMPR